MRKKIAGIKCKDKIGTFEKNKIEFEVCKLILTVKPVFFSIFLLSSNMRINAVQQS